MRARTSGNQRLPFIDAKNSAFVFVVRSLSSMLAGTFVFVFAGTQLAEIHKLGDVLSPGLMLALTLLGLFPLVAKKLMGVIAQRRAGTTP